MLRGRTRRQFGVQSCKLFVTLADLRICGMFRQFAAILFPLAMKDEVFFAHGQLQQIKRRQLSLSLAPRPSLDTSETAIPQSSLRFRIARKSAEFDSTE